MICKVWSNHSSSVKYRNVSQLPVVKVYFSMYLNSVGFCFYLPLPLFIPQPSLALPRYPLARFPSSVVMSTICCILYVSGTAAKVESGNYIEIRLCQETQQCVALDTDTCQVLKRENSSIWL